MSLKFHWMLPKGGEVALDGQQSPREAARYRIESMQSTSPAVRPDLAGWTAFARHAEDARIDSTLISFSRYEPDPFLVACALGQAVQKLKFIIAYRSGLMQPTTFVQQMNTVSALVQGRVSFNIVAGSSSEEQRGYGDYLSHDERYARAEEFLAVCNAFWRANGEVISTANTIASSRRNSRRPLSCRTNERQRSSCQVIPNSRSISLPRRVASGCALRRVRRSWNQSSHAHARAEPGFACAVVCCAGPRVKKRSAPLKPCYPKTRRKARRR